MGEKHGKVLTELIVHIVDDPKTSTLPKKITEEPSYKECIDKHADDHLNLSNTKKFELTCELLAEHANTRQTEDFESVLDSDTRYDLNILAGDRKNPTESLVNKLDRTVTTVGKVMLCAQLLQPITNVEQLKVKQKLITKLQSHLTAVHPSLHRIKAGEHGFLSFWPQHDQFIQNLTFDKITIPGSTTVSYLKELEDACNESEIALLLQEATPPILQITAIGIKYAIPLVALIGGDYKAFFSSIGFALGSGISLANGIRHTARLSLPEKYANFINLGALLYEDKNQIMDTFKELDMRLCELMAMQRKLIALRKFMLSMEHMQSTINVISSFKDLAHKLKLPPKSRDLQKLLELLKSNTFTSEGKLSHWGKIKLAYSLMYKCKHELLQPYAALGELDSLSSSAQLLQELPGKMSLAEYIQQNSPTLSAHNYWNPFLNPHTAVTNTLELGNESQSFAFKTIIVTGKNGKGKTCNTTLAIPLSMLLAQTLCIVPAQKFVATPCEQFLTMIKNETNIGAGNSLFQSIATRVGALRNALKSNKGFALVSLDEPFGGGTISEIAQPSAYTLIEEAGLNPNTLCIVTTHFRDPIELAKKHPQQFGVYKAMENYKIEPGVGVADTDTALKILEEKAGKDFADKIKERIEHNSKDQVH